MNQTTKTKKIFLFFIFILLIGACTLFYFSDELSNICLKPISYLTCEDLAKLSSQPTPSGELKFKLAKQLNTPYIFNKINGWKLKAKNIFSTLKNNSPFTKPYIRVAHWNIERGKNIDAIKTIFLDQSSYYYNYRKTIDGNEHNNFRKELNDLTSSDVIALNEVDIGLPRTKYKNVVSEIADALNYNYAFATEFVELGPIAYMIMIDTKRYLGLHGNAILSKYPIKDAKVIRLPKCYDWFDGENGRKSPLEHIRRYGADKVFHQKILDEIRRGGRCALVANIQLPNNEIVTVVSTHLEDRCYPQERFKQVQDLFNNLRNIRTPIIIAGDLNTSTTDAAPTSFKKEIVKRLKDPHFISRQAVFALIPGAPIAGSIAAVALSKVFQYKDPTAPSVPILFPNQERKFFKYVESFRFADGEGFDSRGDSEKSSNGKSGYFANSNERQLKGFESTFKFSEPRLIAYFKLDWFFVKPKQKRFEPFNGQTLQLINYAYPDRISDHEPITVDLTLTRNQNVAHLVKR